jgi:hypothetical protein
MKLFCPVASHFPITQWFGENPQWYPLTNGHNGIDWGLPLHTPVYSAADGEVVRVSKDNSGYGNHIRIKHPNNFLTLYGHLDTWDWSDVFVGDLVVGGQVIGHSGNTGWSTGPHLHFEVRESNIAIDPAPLLINCLPGQEPQPVLKPIFELQVDDDTTPYLNIRTGPGTTYPIIGRYQPGDKMVVIGFESDTIWVRTEEGVVAMRYKGNNLATPVTEEIS